MSGEDQPLPVHREVWALLFSLFHAQPQNWSVGQETLAWMLLPDPETVPALVQLFPSQVTDVMSYG